MALHKGFLGGQQRTMKYGLVSRDYVLLYRVYQRLLEDYWRLLNYWRLQCSVYTSKQLSIAYKTLANDSETIPHLQVRGSDRTVQFWTLDSKMGYGNIWTMSVDNFKVYTTFNKSLGQTAPSAWKCPKTEFWGPLTENLNPLQGPPHTDPISNKHTEVKNYVWIYQGIHWPPIYRSKLSNALKSKDLAILVFQKIPDTPTKTGGAGNSRYLVHWVVKSVEISWNLLPEIRTPSMHPS